MPANIGEMFYYGPVPWHGEGLALAKPANMEEALRAGGLEWEVGEMDMQTCDDPPSPVRKRKAIVRLDRAPGDDRRVLGVAHRGFRPLQNRDGALLFDAIFGHGKSVYRTGGYLGDGEVVWLLAKLDKPLEVGPGDIVEPYALYANSHDGSKAVTISLTTIRVVCQNTLEIALQQRGIAEQFRRAHHGSFLEHAEAAQALFGSAMDQLDDVLVRFTGLARTPCGDDRFDEILERLLPLPRTPRNIERNPGLKKAHEQRVADLLQARDDIRRLGENGKGMELSTARGTFWGVLSAITEYVDHHREIDGSRVSYALLGDGMDLKKKAFRVIQEYAQAA